MWNICVVAKFGAQMKMSDLGIFWQDFENNVVMFEVSTLEFV